MCSLKKLYNFLRDRRKRKPLPPPLIEASAAVERDLGVVIERNKLPSGGEIVVIENYIGEADEADT